MCGLSEIERQEFHKVINKTKKSFLEYTIEYLQKKDNKDLYDLTLLNDLLNYDKIHNKENS